MNVAIGSTNPVKVAATQTVLAQALPAFTLFPVNVPSGVSAMPQI